MTRHMIHRVCGVFFILTFLPVARASAQSNEIWVAPTYQKDLGGVGTNSNVVWPVTEQARVRFAWAVPNNLQAFDSAKLVLIPGQEAGGTISLHVCEAQDGQHVAAACAGPFAHAYAGSASQLVEVDVSAAIAPKVGVPGSNYLAVFAFADPPSKSDRIVGLRFSYTPVLPSGIATLDANTFTGTQTAPAFAGDGSRLTNLPIPPGMATLGANTFSGTQLAPAFVGDGSGLTNLPMPTGVATLGANRFTATQTIAGGNLDLDAQTSATGHITKKGVRFLHNGGHDSNTFLGWDAGNFSVAEDEGFATAVGFRALHANTRGFNTAIGGSALARNTTGVGNTASGTFALDKNVSGSYNTVSGHSALGSNTAGDFNVAVGINAGYQATTGSQNIYLGANVEGVSGESKAIYLGQQGVHVKTHIGGIRGTTVTGGETVVIDADGRLGSAPVGPAADLACVSCVSANEVNFSFATLAENIFKGTQTAPAFVGDGSAMTNVNAALLAGKDATAFAAAGHGHFVSQIANAASVGANTFIGTQTIDGGGNLDLTTGHIATSGAPFLHNFGFRNTFLGLGAGNFAMTGTANTAVGFDALRSNDTGVSNTAVGFQALQGNAGGDNNTATGLNALVSNTTGSRNTAGGIYALANNYEGHGNTAIGSDALVNNTAGESNVAIGDRAGINAFTGSNNIYLGANVAGIADDESNAIYLGKQGTQTKTVIAGIRQTTVGDAEMVVIDAAGRLSSTPVGALALENNSVTADKVAFNYAASVTEGGAASDVACAGCISASEVSFSFVGTLANTFTGNQTINSGNIDLDGSSPSGGNITKNGTRFLHNFGQNNTFLGFTAGNLTMSGGQNTGLGFQALFGNTTGSHNTAIGHNAMLFTASGGHNTAVGVDSLRNASGFDNTAIGANALSGATQGRGNIAIGAGAGSAPGFVAPGSNNIYLGATLLINGESNAMYLGNPLFQHKTVIAGVRGRTTLNANAVPVLIDSAGQLGTVSSSRRFKEDIRDMADASRRLLQLRPVTFQYQRAFADGSKPTQYGLIAEEVAEVFPELAVRNADGEIETVHYELLNVLLLNELQKQERRIETLERQLELLLGRVRDQ